MNIVIDTSAILAVIVNEPEKEALINLTKGADLIAPHSVHWEIGNAFSAMFKRNRVSLAEALPAIQAYRTIPIRFVNAELEQSLAIAEALDIYAYDAYLIWCAIKYKAPIISLDKGLVNAAKRKNVKILEVT